MGDGETDGLHGRLEELERALHQAQERLRALEAQTGLYRVLIERSLTGIYLIQGNRYFFANPTYCEMTGRSWEELSRSDPLSVIHPEERELVRDRLRRRLAGEEVAGDYETRILRPDGQVRHVWVRAIRVFHEGQPAVIGNLADITALREADRALRESEERYRNLMELLPEGVWVQRAGVILFVNRSMARLLGASEPEEILGRSVYDFVHPDCQESVRARTQQVMEEGTTVPLKEQRYLALDGSWVEVETSATAVTFQGQRAVMAVYRDIRERKRQEEERRRLEQRFLQAQKMEAVGTLAGGIAHDFNNLLMAIQGNVSLMLLELPEDHPHMERLEEIQEAVRNGAHLTKQLLGFARGGRYQLEPLDMNQVLEQTSAMFGRARKEITIHKRFQADLWSVEADRGQMEQVLMNLFVNAADAMPQGGELFLDTQNVVLDEDYLKPYSMSPGRYVRISVTDSGIGMDEETLKYIFEPFFTTKTMDRGTGLGLATVYGIVKGHGGLITVYSTPGEGSTFHIYLPVSSRQPGGELRLPKGVLRGTGKVLIVDDEETILKVSSHMLRALGYEVLTAKGGRKGIETYCRHAPEIDLVILDMIMPDMSGGEVFEALRKVNPQVRVLLSSGYAQNGRAREMLAKGCLGFIQKPFTLAELSQRVKTALHEP